MMHVWDLISTPSILEDVCIYSKGHLEEWMTQHAWKTMEEHQQHCWLAIIIPIKLIRYTANRSLHSTVKH